MNELPCTSNLFCPKTVTTHSYDEHNYSLNQHKTNSTPTSSDFRTSPQASDQSDGVPWQVVSQKNKRIYSNHNTGSDQKKCRPNSSDNSGNKSIDVPISNNFTILAEEDPNTMEETSSNETKKEPKPPPIFIPDVQNVTKMVQVIESVLTRDEYFYKCLPNNKIRITPLTSDVYRKLVRKLSELNVGFHTFQLKQERAFRTVLKNMHYSTDPADIINAINAYGHNVRNVSNARSAKTKTPLGMFFVDLEPAKNNKDIYDIEFLLNAKVKFEPPYKKNDIVQCKKCQRYGHSKSYCWYPFRCVKCGSNHETSACTKSKDVSPKCVLCNGDHPANYKGCNTYKNLKNKTFPPLRQKSLTSHTTNDIISKSETPMSPTTHENNHVNESVSYAQATKNGPNSSTGNELSTLTQVINSVFEKFETLLTQQTQQVGTLISLLTTVISKLK